jgi:hypothetical protein
MRPRFFARSTVLVLGLILYVGSYLVLSAFGRYSSVRAQSVFTQIRVDWAPIGFVTAAGQWNWLLHGLYLPLYSLDRAFWHTDTRHSAIAPYST